jgi:hypothetical protein
MDAYVWSSEMAPGGKRQDAPGKKKYRRGMTTEFELDLDAYQNHPTPTLSPMDRVLDIVHVPRPSYQSLVREWSYGAWILLGKVTGSSEDFFAPWKCICSD